MQEKTNPLGLDESVSYCPIHQQTLGPLPNVFKIITILIPYDGATNCPGQTRRGQ